MGARTKRNEHSGRRQWDDTSLFSSATSADVAMYAEAELSSSSSEPNMASARRSPGRNQHRGEHKPSVELDLFEFKHRPRGRHAESKSPKEESMATVARAKHASTTSSSESFDIGGPRRAGSFSVSSSDIGPRMSRPTSPKTHEPSKQAYFSPTHRGLSPYHSGQRGWTDGRGRPAFPPIEEYRDVTVTINPEAATPDEIARFSPDINLVEESEIGTPREVMVTIRPEAALTHEIGELESARASVEEPTDEFKSVMVTVRPEPARQSEIAPTPLLLGEELSDGPISADYTSVANELQINPSCLEPPMEDDGLVIENAFISVRYGQQKLEQVRVRLRISRQEPVLGLKVLSNAKHPYRVLLIVDALTAPSQERSALNYFTYFKWPRGPQQLAEVAASHIVVAYMRNMRDPLIFAFENQTEQRKLLDVLRIAQGLAQKRHEAWKANSRAHAYPPDSPLPKVMLVEKQARKWVKNYDLFCQRRDFFLKKLSIVCKKSRSDNAVKNYLEAAKTDQLDQWVILWNPSNNRYETSKAKVWIHHSSPFMMVTDSKGKTQKKGLGGYLDLLSLTACRTSVEANQGYPPEIRPKEQTPHMLSMDCLNMVGKKVYFRFETAERMKDFQQTVCCLSYLQQFDLE